MEHTDQRRQGQNQSGPERGPRILFFSGGTALRDTSGELIHSTHNSIHLVTPFDSGGSSAVIRRAFHMPAVGDIRNRLMALADQTAPGGTEIFALFTHRLAKDRNQTELLRELESMAEGEHPLVRHIPDPMRTIILVHFHRFLAAMPPDFDLKGASLGNLVLTAGYLSNRRRIDPAIEIFSRLARVRGVVRPTLDQDLHLAASLKDGRVVVGQHLLTGKEADPLASPVRDVWLTASQDSREPVTPSISAETEELIAGADLICYPPGSFYTSIVANLLPRGVGRAVAAAPCPKVFVPNTAADPENLDLGAAAQARVLAETLRRSGAPADRAVLTAVLIDSKNGPYPNAIDQAALVDQGLEVIDRPLVTPGSAPLADPRLLAEALLSLS